MVEQRKGKKTAEFPFPVRRLCARVASCCGPEFPFSGDELPAVEKGRFPSLPHSFEVKGRESVFWKPREELCIVEPVEAGGIYRKKKVREF
jgi:hypothetical protein